jgi:hypothetical protein
MYSIFRLSQLLSVFQNKGIKSRARICKPFKEPRNRFQAWRASAITLFGVPARQATLAGRINSSYRFLGLLKRLQILAQDGCSDSDA